MGLDIRTPIGLMFGIFGLLLAVPVTVFIREIVKSTKLLRSDAEVTVEKPVD